MGFGVVLISVSAFLLSYTNLYAAAVEAGIPPLLAPLWPLNLDAFLAVSSLFILRCSIRGESTKSGWAVLLLFTGVSSIFNVVHSQPDMLSRSAHLVPPIALMISLEVMMLIIKSDLKFYKVCDFRSIIDTPVQQVKPQNQPSKKNKVLEYLSDTTDKIMKF